MLQFWEAVLIDVGTLLVVVLNGSRPLGLDFCFGNPATSNLNNSSKTGRVNNNEIEPTISYAPISTNEPDISLVKR